MLHCFSFIDRLLDFLGFNFSEITVKIFLGLKKLFSVQYDYGNFVGDTEISAAQHHQGIALQVRAYFWCY